MTAAMRTDPLARDVVQRLSDAQDEFNQLGNILTEPPIALTVRMQDYVKIAALDSNLQSAD